MLEGAGQGANAEHQELTAHGRQKQTLPFYGWSVHTQQLGGGGGYHSPGLPTFSTIPLP